MHIADVSGSALFNADCMDILPLIPDKSVQLILADLPYGTTACKWDSIIPLEPLWKEYKRIIKDNGAIVLTASQPFTTKLISSNYDWFKYEWIWEKDGGSNFATVKYMPMKEHENILVFGKGKILYNEQREERIGSRKGKITKTKDSGRTESVYGTQLGGLEMVVPELRCPRSIQRFTRERGLHPTQKPLEMMKYFIATYSDENDYVLDNTMGVGTTCLGAKELNRSFIGIEKEVKYKPNNFALANKMPMKYHENVLVFYKKQPKYNKQMEKRDGTYRDWETDRKSTRLNSSHITRSRMPSSA